MGDVKWIKVTTDMFEDEKIRLIDAMPERDTIHYIWIRLLVQAGKTNSHGFIFLGEDIPYTDEMLSTIFCRPLSSIRLALKTLSAFRMIQVDEDNFIKITNWEKYQNVEGMEKVREQNKIRAKKYREKKKQLKSAINCNEDDKCDDVYKESYVSKNELFQCNSINDNNIFYSNDISKDEISNGDFSSNSEIFKANYENDNVNSKMELLGQSLNNKSDYESFEEDKILDESLDDEYNILTKNLCNVTNLKSNVMENEDNVIVTKQNKRENKRKNKNKNSIIDRENESNEKAESTKDKNNNESRKVKDTESHEVKNNESHEVGIKDIESHQLGIKDNNSCGIENNYKNNNESYVIENGKNTINNALSNIDTLSVNAGELLKYYESITGVIGGLNLGSLKLAISSHGYDNVKMAINKALEFNKGNMNYINGILKNWRKEGYPSKNDKFKGKDKRRVHDKSKRKGTNLKFDNFEPREYDYDDLEKKLLGW
ncbi:DnaD domain protein [Clostridium botulinum]|uniref:phage replisome organizer N-terminal domain-containing protein n=1 Tax=Clostridium botulinum TaxID=1491 RepID=UPI0013F0AEDA|nr:phage replisome organizer N-terminal domain-containing protein [Clostridium botulinum]MBY6836887.1 phage replisome organizer N-terminal domain-containing protein [Clostridium botulinum]NFG66433.1 DnaD domain protein [Clostridium botulinum]NFL34972.1 DnaD domain protein [Clostridium botulinum]NFM04551.1 DnaD domain protein [Clostridium botulinum]NFQ23600.1 DnaD domain protein [Clostridium botulinum]